MIARIKEKNTNKQKKAFEAEWQDVLRNKVKNQ